jgi:soluble lytic murein transglycosylase-like protein
LAGLIAGATRADVSDRPPDAPRIELLSEGPLFKRQCLTTTVSAPKHYEKLVQWRLSCAPDVFVAAVREALKDAPEKEPELRLLVARVAREEVRRLRDVVEKEEAAKKQGSFELQELLTWDGLENFFFPKTESTSHAKREPSPAAMSTEGRVLSETSALVSELSGWLAPVRSASDSSPLSVLKEEATLEAFLAYGQTLRFQAAYEILNRGELNMRRSWISERVLAEVMTWVEKDGGGPLREWLRAELARERPSEINGAKPRHLDVWLQSLLLEGGQGADENAKKAWVLARLRDLWVAYPATGDATKIRAAAEKLGLAREFRAPTVSEMSLSELLVRAQSQVRLLDGNGALRTIRRVLTLSSANVQEDDYWTAMQMHIRILRILDQRHQIPELLRSYEERAHFRTVGAGEDAARAYGRIIDISKHHWTYESGRSALNVLEPVFTAARAPDAVKAQALYVKARVLEQAQRPDEAFAAIGRALEQRKFLTAELVSDLSWRKVFLLFDRIESFGGISPPLQSGASAKGIHEALANAKKLATDSFDRARAVYWTARAFELEKREDEAKKAYTEAYKIEAFSFYSNLAGLALERLGEKPKDWNVSGVEDHEEPDLKPFLAAPATDSQRQFARVYGLARIGDATGIGRALPELGKALADEILAKGAKPAQRLKLARAGAWLRRAVGDAFGSLKTAEVARTALIEDFEGDDYSYLYPLPYWDIIRTAAEPNSLDPWVVASLIRQESAFDSNARSPANALGLMQMIPPVAKAEAKKLSIDGFEPEQLYSPELAVKLGTSHLGDLVKSFQGSLICSFAAYNAGRPPVLKWLSYYPSGEPLSFVERIPYQETRNYVRSILRNFINYRRIYGDGKVDYARLVQMPAASVDESENKKVSDLEVR